VVDILGKIAEIAFPGSSGADEPKDASYPLEGRRWYQTYPYAFQAMVQEEGTVKRKQFFLPISPQNLSITSHFATNVVATFGGTVEEHSKVRYFDITIQGTTGFAPKYYKSVDISSPNPEFVGPPAPITSGATKGRMSYQSGEILGSLGGFFAGTIGKVNQALNKAQDAIYAALGKAKPFQPGVFFDSSGYAAFHNLYTFLLEHKKFAASGLPMSKGQEVPLVFVNYKDNNQYSCAVQRFTLSRSADNPMLYNYVIQLRAYDLSPIASNQFSFFSLKDRLDQLGLTQDPSILSRIKLTVRNGKGAINSAAGALNTLGT
jgi:hypothetical protein